MIEFAKMCGEKRVVQEKKARKGSEWWNDEMLVIVREKNSFFGRYLQEKSVNTWEINKRMRREVNRKVIELKKSVNERWGQKVANKFRENKCFGKK